MERRFYSITREIEVDRYINPTLKGGKVAEAQTIGLNTYAYSTNLGTHINSGSTTKGTIEFPVGYLKQGDSVVVSAEFLSKSGVLPKLIIEYNATGGSGIGASAVSQQIDKVSEFVNVEYKHVAEADGYYRAVFGIVTADVGEFYVRNPFAYVRSIVSTSKPPSVDYSPSTKQFSFSMSGGVPVLQPLYTYDQGTITIDSDNPKRIRLAFSEPFTDTRKRVTVVDGMNSTMDPPTHVIKTESLLNNEITFYIYDLATNTRVNIADVPNGLFFQFVVHGYDLI